MDGGIAYPHSGERLDIESRPQACAFPVGKPTLQPIDCASPALTRLGSEPVQLCSAPPFQPPSLERGSFRHIPGRPSAPCCRELWQRPRRSRKHFHQPARIRARKTPASRASMSFAEIGAPVRTSATTRLR